MTATLRDLIARVHTLKPCKDYAEAESYACAVGDLNSALWDNAEVIADLIEAATDFEMLRDALLLCKGDSIKRNTDQQDEAEKRIRKALEALK